MTDFRILHLHVSNSVVLLLQENIQNTTQRILTKYDCLQNEFAFNEISPDVCLSICWNEYFPLLFVSPSTISIPTFSTTQEELIDNVS